MMLGADHSDPVSNTIILRDSHPTWLLLRRRPITASSLKQLPDIYSAPPDKKLFYYEPGGERGIRFDINDGRVSGIVVGTTSIEYVEGCL